MGREECPLCEGDGFGQMGGNCLTCGGGGKVTHHPSGAGADPGEQKIAAELRWLPYQRIDDKVLLAAIYLDSGEHLLVLRPFGWHLGGYHISNAAEHFSREVVCEEHGWQVVCDYGPYVAIVKSAAAARLVGSPEEIIWHAPPPDGWHHADTPAARATCGYCNPKETDHGTGMEVPALRDADRNAEPHANSRRESTAGAEIRSAANGNEHEVARRDGLVGSLEEQTDGTQSHSLSEVRRDEADAVRDSHLQSVASEVAPGDGRAMKDYLPEDWLEGEIELTAFALAHPECDARAVLRGFAALVTKNQAEAGDGRAARLQALVDAAEKMTGDMRAWGVDESRVNYHVPPMGVYWLVRHMADELALTLGGQPEGQ